MCLPELTLSLDFANREGGSGYNTAIVVAPDGTLAARMRTLHIAITTGYREDHYCTPGPAGAVLGAKQVAAVDPSIPFVDACRRRLPGVHVEVASAAGVRELRRVTRLGGTDSVAVRDNAGETTLLRCSGTQRSRSTHPRRTATRDAACRSALPGSSPTSGRRPALAT